MNVVDDQGETDADLFAVEQIVGFERRGRGQPIEVHFGEAPLGARDEQEQAKTSDGDRAMTPQIHRLSVPRASSPAANASCAAPPTREILRGRRCTW